MPGNVTPNPHSFSVKQKTLLTLTQCNSMRAPEELIILKFLAVEEVVAGPAAWTRETSMEAAKTTAIREEKRCQEASTRRLTRTIFILDFPKESNRCKPSVAKNLALYCTAIQVLSEKMTIERWSSKEKGL